MRKSAQCHCNQGMSTFSVLFIAPSHIFSSLGSQHKLASVRGNRLEDFHVRLHGGRTGVLGWTKLNDFIYTGKGGEWTQKWRRCRFGRHDYGERSYFLNGCRYERHYDIERTRHLRVLKIRLDRFIKYMTRLQICSSLPAKISSGSSCLIIVCTFVQFYHRIHGYIPELGPRRKSPACRQALNNRQSGFFSQSSSSGFLCCDWRSGARSVGCSEPSTCTLLYIDGQGGWSLMPRSFEVYQQLPHALYSYISYYVH